MVKLGVCYYPEHWDQSIWVQDAQRMVEAGISVVRIGEFAWSRIEPISGEYQFEWLDEAIETLAKAGLEVVLGTPTATPPKWLVDRFPEILPVDENGVVRGFGSRRHYCFSSPVYRVECKRIVSVLAQRYGNHPAITGWQTDNEYGCHDTIFSYSSAARLAFQQWCESHYESIDALNTAWGNVFWSMEYQSFDQIELPIGAVTELSPAHQLAFWRFSSDQVVSFNKLQTDILRAHSPGRLLVHNYMGNFLSFDHHDVAKDLDVASWDSYPMGFLDRDTDDQAELKKWYRTGHPDTSAMHHDLYRGVGDGRWWVMEQQPGPVNWAPHNPSPLPGMVRLWGWEAIAHGAEVVSYFRWRQAPFAQEQNHAGLLLPDGTPDTGLIEVTQLAKELEPLQTLLAKPAAMPPVAIVFDYVGNAIQEITNVAGDSHQPYSYFAQIYSACRSGGIDVDIVNSQSDLTEYKLVIVANQMIASQALLAQLEAIDAQVLLMTGCGSRTEECAIPPSLAPGNFRSLIDITINRSESLPECAHLAVNTAEADYVAAYWRERVVSDLQPMGVFEDGWGFHYVQGRVHYLNAVLTKSSLQQFIRHRLDDADVAICDGIDGIRYRACGSVRFAFNYGPDTVTLSEQTDYLLGQSTLAPGDVAAWSSDTL